MAGPDLNTLVREFYADALLGVDQDIGRAAVIVSARPGDGDRAFVAALGRPRLIIEGSLHPTRDAVREELLRRLAVALLGDAPATSLVARSPAGDRARLAIADAYGRRADRVVDLLLNGRTVGPAGVGLELAEILDGATGDQILVVLDAHRLEPDARWDLREYPGPVLLMTSPAQLGALVSADAPFYGQARTIELAAPAVREWAATLDRLGAPAHPSDLEWVLQRTRRRVATTYEALRRVTARRSLRSAWRDAVADAIPRAHEALLLASAVHALAPRLLTAIACGDAPYPALAEAPHQRVALALQKMRSFDLIEQPTPRMWAIADPLLERAIVSIIQRDRLIGFASDAVAS